MFDALRHPVVITAFILLVWCLLSAFWGPPDWPKTHDIISKMLKLFCIPFFAIGFLRMETRQYAQTAFLIAMTLTAIVSLFMAFTGKLWMGGVDAGTVFNDRIMTGMFVSMGAWLAAHLAVQPTARSKWWLWTVFLVCSLQVAFANTGRTGYVVYLLLAVAFSLMNLTFRQTISFLICLSLIAVMAYWLSPTLAKNVDRTIYNILHFQQVARSSSIGYRVGFHQYAQKLFLLHPIIGNGAGSFSWHYAQDQPMPFYSNHLFEPHSQYWLIMSEQGLIGLLAFIAWLLTLVWLIIEVKQSRAFLLFAFISINAANFSDSMLLYSATGYLLMITVAMAVGEHIQHRTTSVTADEPLSIQSGYAS